MRTQTIGDYEVAEFLGRANHGSYFRVRPPARLEADSRWVLLKVLGREASDDEFRRISAELQLLASVRSPYLVGLLDAGAVSGTVYYAMELPKDGTLKTVAAGSAAPRVVRAVAHAARGAHALHEVGVTHRDIKPDNVFTHSGGARLADLGLAQVADPAAATTGRGPVGAVEFIDPALVRGARAGRSSDIWALGATLHHALTQESLYPDVPRRGFLAAIRHVATTRPRVSSALPAEIRQIVDDCTREQPADRPATAELVADRLEELIA